MNRNEKSHMSEHVKAILPDLSVAALLALQTEFGVDEGPRATLKRLMTQFVKRGQLEFLIQTVITDDDAEAFIVVVPFESASALES